jgi:hypothetical protein
VFGIAGIVLLVWLTDRAVSRPRVRPAIPAVQMEAAS